MIRHHRGCTDGHCVHGEVPSRVREALESTRALYDAGVLKCLLCAAVMAGGGTEIISVRMRDEDVFPYGVCSGCVDRAHGDVTVLLADVDENLDSVRERRRAEAN